MRASSGEIVCSDEVQSMIDEGIHKSHQDWHAMQEKAQQFYLMCATKDVRWQLALEGEMTQDAERQTTMGFQRTMQDTHSWNFQTNGQTNAFKDWQKWN